MAETIEERFALYLANVEKQMQIVQSLRTSQNQNITNLQAAVESGQDTTELVDQINKLDQVLDAQMSATLDVVATPPGIVGLTATIDPAVPEGEQPLPQ